MPKLKQPDAAAEMPAADMPLAGALLTLPLDRPQLRPGRYPAMKVGVNLGSVQADGMRFLVAGLVAAKAQLRSERYVKCPADAVRYLAEKAAEEMGV